MGWFPHPTVPLALLLALCAARVAAGGADASDRLAAARAAYGAAAISVLQFSAPLSAQVFFLSPVAVMRTIVREGSTGDLQVLPFSMMAANGCTWLGYATLMGDASLFYANIPAFVCGVLYTAVFLRYNSRRTGVALPLAVAGAICAVVAYLVVYRESQPMAATAIGTLGCVVVIAMFSSPLAAIQRVLRTQSAAALSCPMTIATVVTTTLWSLYGLALGDVFIYGPNGMGLVAGAAQLYLIVRFAKRAEGTHAGLPPDAKDEDA